MRNASRALVLAALGCYMSMSFAQQPPGAAPSAPAAAPAAPQRPASMSTSITTVQDLLTLENALAVKQALKQRVDAGLASPEAPAATKSQVVVAAPPMTANVDAIFGTGDHLRAHLTVMGQPFTNVTVGSRVKTCEVVRIADRCVVMRPAPGVPNAPACPAACWTGVPPAPPVMASGVPGMPGGMPGSPLPMPMPTGGQVAMQAPQSVPVQAVPTPPPTSAASGATQTALPAGLTSPAPQGQQPAAGAPR